MTFRNILIALDGSKNSQIAAEYGFWLASELEAQLTAIHAVDPRLVDLFLEREFSEELGFAESVETSQKVFGALKRIGRLILELYSKEAANRGVKTSALLAEGYIVEEILRNEKKYDLLILGCRGRAQSRSPAGIILGSVAERVAICANIPVLITVQPMGRIEQILVAYDGSEPSRGALLMAENLAKNLNCKLKAITVVPSEGDKVRSKFLIEEGESYLREYSGERVFYVKEGAVAQGILEDASSNSLLVLGAYGFRDPDKTVLGSTTTSIIRQTNTSVLIYKPNLHLENIEVEDKTERVASK